MIEAIAVVAIWFLGLAASFAVPGFIAVARGGDDLGSLGVGILWGIAGASAYLFASAVSSAI